MAGTDGKLENLVVSDYGTKVNFSFTNEGKYATIMEAWAYARKVSEEMLGIEDYENITADESAVKLVVDGETVPFVRGGDVKPMEVNVYIFEVDVASKKAGFDLTFKPIEYGTAESVVLEIETDNGAKKINLK